MKTINLDSETKKQLYALVGWGMQNHPGCKTCLYRRQAACLHPNYMRKPGVKHPNGGGPRPCYKFNGHSNCILWESETGETLLTRKRKESCNIL